jgi:hypothetical protein
MANLPIYYNTPNAQVPVKVVFLNANGVAVDPTTITLVLTDPTGTSITVDPGDVIRVTTGNYLYSYQVPDDGIYGLWNYTWVGVGTGVVNGAQVTAGAFRLTDMNSAAGRNRTYISMEELKSSLNDVSGQSKDDYEYQRACITSTTLIHDLCGQHFMQVIEPRTYSYDSIYELFIDPIVPGSITEFALDYEGNGDYNTIWTEGQDFQTLRYSEQYNPRNLGEARPHDFVRVLLNGVDAGVTPGGEMLPFVWAYTPNNRVKITGTWGWAEIPQNVTHAALLLAVDLFKMKDAPWGIAGMGELGMVKTQANPEVMELLAKYREPRNLVGV